MPEYLPDGYVPPIYRVRERDLFLLQVFVGLFGLGVLVLPLLLVTNLADTLMYAAGAAVWGWIIRTYIDNRKFKREVEALTKDL